MKGSQGIFTDYQQKRTNIAKKWTEKSVLLQIDVLYYLLYKFISVAIFRTLHSRKKVIKNAKGL